MLHGTRDVDPPVHCRPPCAGLGFVHVLDLCCIPRPHVLEHDPDKTHALQPPCTERIYKTIVLLSKIYNVRCIVYETCIESKSASMHPSI